MIGDEFACSECYEGYYFDPIAWDCTGECSSKYHEACSECDVSYCSKCNGGWMLSLYQETCVPKIDFCADSQIED